MIELALASLGHSLRLPLICGAIMAVSVGLLWVMHDVRQSGYLRAEASRLQDITANNLEVADRQKRALLAAGAAARRAAEESGAAEGEVAEIIRRTSGVHPAGVQCVPGCTFSLR